MTAKEFADMYVKNHIRYVHADNDKRIHEKARASPDDYEFVRCRLLRNKLYVEVRERSIHENKNGT